MCYMLPKPPGKDWEYIRFPPNMKTHLTPQENGNVELFLLVRGAFMPKRETLIASLISYVYIAEPVPSAVRFKLHGRRCWSLQHERCAGATSHKARVLEDLRTLGRPDHAQYWREGACEIRYVLKFVLITSYIFRRILDRWVCAAPSFRGLW